MTAEDLSDSLRRRSNLNICKDQTGSNKTESFQQTGAGDMVKTGRIKKCCYHHKLKISGIIIGIILFGGLIACILVAVKMSRNHSSEGCLVFSKSRTCLSTDEERYRHYGTKTDYLVAKSELVTPTLSNKLKCDPVHFYLLSRHAIRYPDLEDIDNMAMNLPILKSKILNSAKIICEEDLKELKLWNFQLDPEKENHVTPSGEKQAEEIAKNFQKMFPTLLKNTYTSETYQFGITNKPRTKETAVAFARGLFQQDIKTIPYIINDYLLHFNKNCSEILKRNGYKKDSSKEVKRFLAGELMHKTLSDISYRVGFNLTLDDVDLMLRACAFEYAIFRKSPWCVVFHKNNIRVLEYYSDMDDYNDDLYGNPRNVKQACPVIKDIIEQIDKAIAGTPRKSLLYFSHAGVMKKVYAHLGLFRDRSRFEADNFCAHVSRVWRSSWTCPFNSNLAIMLYKCEGKHYIEAYVQEKPVIINGCKSTFCLWEDFKNTYSSVVNNCNLEDICVP